jgi:hypothetical protein
MEERGSATWDGWTSAAADPLEVTKSEAREIAMRQVVDGVLARRPGNREVGVALGCISRPSTAVKKRSSMTALPRLSPSLRVVVKQR